MLMVAATHTGGSAHSSSISQPPPWHPVVLVPNHNHHQQHQVLYDLDLATPSPSPTTPAATASPPRHNHLRRAGKRRRPRPSRKLPTTYISADAASCRRMVHQVTGADDVLLPAGHAAPAPELLCLPAAPSRGALTSMLTLLPTLDTSAFLLGAAGGGAVRGGAPRARPGVSCCHGSAADPGAPLQVEAEACGGGGGIPSLESWDEDDALL